MKTIVDEKSCEYPNFAELDVVNKDIEFTIGVSDSITRALPELNDCVSKLDMITELPSYLKFEDNKFVLNVCAVE
jgi:hypothetical protein